MDVSFNRLWGGLPTEENMALAEQYPHFYANSDHVLVIAPEQPQGLVEMTGRFQDALQPQDWRWILEERSSLLQEQQATYAKEFGEFGNSFLSRFETELNKRREGMRNGGADEGDQE